MPPVPLKSNRVASSRAAWSTALRTSCMSTSETTSKLGMAPNVRGEHAAGGRGTGPPWGPRSLTVGREGFEPPKPKRLVYSQFPLSTRAPTREGRHDSDPPRRAPKLAPARPAETSRRRAILPRVLGAPRSIVLRFCDEGSGRPDGGDFVVVGVGAHHQEDPRAPCRTTTRQDEAPRPCASSPPRSRWAPVHWGCSPPSPPPPPPLPSMPAPSGSASGASRPRWHPRSTCSRPPTTRCRPPSTP